MTDSFRARTTSFVHHMARVMSDASGVAGVLMLLCTRGGQKRLVVLPSDVSRLRRGEVRLDGARDQSLDEHRSIPVANRGERGLVEANAQVRHDTFRDDAGSSRCRSTYRHRVINRGIGVVLGGNDGFEQRE